MYLSRHEFNTMRRDPEWHLVAVRLTPERSAAAVATVSRGWVVEQAPKDNSSVGRWESCRLEVPPDALNSGIPALAHVLADDSSPLLTGAVTWPGI